MPRGGDRERDYRDYRDRRNDTPTNIDSRYASGRAVDSYVPECSTQQSGGTAQRGRQPSGRGQQPSSATSRETPGSRRYDASHQSRRDRSRSPDRRGRDNGSQQLRRAAAARAIQAHHHYRSLQIRSKRSTSIISASFLKAQQSRRRSGNGMPVKRQTPKARALNDYITSVQNSKVGPYDIDALRIRNMQNHQVDNVARNMGVTLAHLHAKQYEDSFAEDDWRKTLEEKTDLIEPGVVFKARMRKR